MALPDRLILHPPPGAGSLLLGEHPLGAGRVNAMLAHNGRFLARANACRPLASHGGWRAFYGAATRGAGWTGTPSTPGDLSWLRSSGQYANVCLSTHYVWPEAWLAAPPLLVLRFRVAVTSPHTCGVALVVVPGTGGPLMGRCTGQTYTGATYQDGVVSMALTPADLVALSRPILHGDGTGTVDESGSPTVMTVYAAAYCSSGTKGQGADVIGLSLGLEPQS